MPVITPDRLANMLVNTNRKFGEPKFTQIAQRLVNYVAFDNLVRPGKMETQDGGRGLQWNVMVNLGGSARNVGIGGPDSVSQVETMVQATADWRGSTANYSIFEEELAMNKGSARIVDEWQARRVNCLIDIAELIETNFWGPPVALSDEVTPWGVKTWLVKNATEGFNGAAPSGHTTIGLNPSTYTNWKNYTFQYTNLTEDDGIDKWLRANRLTDWKAPMGVEHPSFDKGMSKANYVNEATISTLEKYLKANNENLGTDIAKYQGSVMFNRHPVTFVKKLDDDTTNPIYGIDWSYFTTIVLKGWWLREKTVPSWPFQHTLMVVFKDCRYQHVMRNRRTSYVGATGTTEPS